jgi:Na+-translocating ferredoxin:NAD+ oxidoreductase RnfG subunit
VQSHEHLRVFYQHQRLSIGEYYRYNHVKQDGGTFDAFTGATITPRAIVTATYQVLELLNKPCPFSKKPCN